MMKTSTCEIARRLETAPSVFVETLDIQSIRELEALGFTVLLDMDATSGSVLGYTVQQRPPAAVAAEDKPKKQQQQRHYSCNICFWVIRMALLLGATACVSAMVCIYVMATVAEMEFIIHQMQQQKDAAAAAEISCNAFSCIGCAWRTPGEPLSSVTNRRIASAEMRTVYHEQFWKACNKCCPTSFF